MIVVIIVDKLMVTPVHDGQAQGHVAFGAVHSSVIEETAADDHRARPARETLRNCVLAVRHCRPPASEMTLRHVSLMKPDVDCRNWRVFDTWNC